MIMNISLHHCSSYAHKDDTDGVYAKENNHDDTIELKQAFYRAVSQNEMFLV